MPSQTPVKGLLLRAMAANDMDKWSRNPMGEQEGDYPSAESAEQDAMPMKMGLLNRFSYPESKGSKPQFILPGESENDVPMMRVPHEDHIDQHEHFTDSRVEQQLNSPTLLPYNKIEQGFYSNHFNNSDNKELLNEMSKDINSSSWDSGKGQYPLLASNDPVQLLQWEKSPDSENKKGIQYYFDTFKKVDKVMDKALLEKWNEGLLRSSLNPNELKPFPLVAHPKTKEAPITFNGNEAPTPEFVNGSEIPTINRGKGSGVWGENPRRFSEFAKKIAIQAELPFVSIALPDATRHLQHYLGNTGEDYQVDLKRIVETTDAGRELYLSQRNGAIKYAIENAKDGVPLDFSSKRLEQRVFAEGTENWFYASGNFSGYSQSKVIRNGDNFSMKFELNYIDPYDWDRIKTPLFNAKDILDKDMAEFHKQGIAKDFLLTGKLPLIITWKVGNEMNPTVKIDQSKMPKPSHPQR